MSSLTHTLNPLSSSSFRVLAQLRVWGRQDTDAGQKALGLGAKMLRIHILRPLPRG